MAEGKLAGRVALVTGAGRRAGIGFAVARQLLEHGADVLVHSWRDDDVAAVVEELGRVGPRVAHVEADLAEPDAPQRVVAEALERFGALDVLVANHARDSGYALETLTA
jgi:3-oxoacyl-[acyl-carrier protein] reductase